MKNQTKLKYSPDESKTFWEKLKINEAGLVTAIIVDSENAEVLMQAYQDKEAFMKTLESGLMYYRSRSRQKLWLKGETSGHFQTVVDIKVDCDADCLLYYVRQKGAACHTGSRSCFYRSLGEL